MAHNDNRHGITSICFPYRHLDADPRLRSARHSQRGLELDPDIADGWIPLREEEQVPKTPVFVEWNGTTVAVHHPHLQGTHHRGRRAPKRRPLEQATAAEPRHVLCTAGRVFPIDDDRIQRLFEPLGESTYGGVDDWIRMEEARE